MIRRCMISAVCAITLGLGGCATAPGVSEKIASIPAEFRGEWNETPRACSSGGSDVRIDEHSADQWEDSSVFRDIRVLGPGHVRVQSDDYGEQTADSTPGSDYTGRHWSELVLSENGQNLTWTYANGRSANYWRCTPEG